jgi:DNA-binding XRE family transcriptional regulator
MGQLNLNGSLDVSHFVFRPGKVFANFLFGSGRQTALLSALALTYDPYRQKAEKRLTRYLSWQWRCQAGKGCNSKTYRVATLLEGIGNEINARFPHRTREGLEAALDTLQVDQIIASWEYERWDEETATKKGWLQHWQEATIVIKPPVEIVERYLTVDHRESLPPPSQTLIERLRLRRESLGLSQAQVAKQMGLNQSTLNRLERGIQTASREVRPKIQNWLQATESASE